MYLKVPFPKGYKKSETNPTWASILFLFCFIIFVIVIVIIHYYKKVFILLLLLLYYYYYYYAMLKKAEFRHVGEERATLSGHVRTKDISCSLVLTEALS